MDDFKIEPAIIDDVSQIALFQVDMAKESENLDLDYNTVWSGVLAVFEDVEKGSYLVARDAATGKATEFKSKLVVDVTLPDGDSFTAWQCMNFLQTGTMYKTDNEKWMVLVNGFPALVYAQTKEDPTRYFEVYRGILCESPKTDYEPNPKWRNLKKNAQGKWR